MQREAQAEPEDVSELPACVAVGVYTSFEMLPLPLAVHVDASHKQGQLFS